MKHWRPREDRKTVRLGVRVRTDEGWTDAVVHNVSSRGMMLRTLQPLQRNQFVEIARGRSRVVGRIVWQDSAVCGLQAQDPVDIPGLLAGPTGASPASGDGGAERRSAERPGANDPRADLETKAQSARLIGRAFEKLVLIAAVSGGALLAVTSVFEAVADPLGQVHYALASPPG